MTVLVRAAVRVLLADPDARVLLLGALDPEDEDTRRFWFPPGGGVEDGEDVQAAAVREVAEETGFALPPSVGIEVWERRHVFAWRGEEIDQRERWFLARVPAFSPDTSRQTAQERAELSEPRWWTLDEMEATDDRLVPRDLAARLRALGL